MSINFQVKISKGFILSEKEAKKGKKESNLHRFLPLELGFKCGEGKEGRKRREIVEKEGDCDDEE